MPVSLVILKELYINFNYYCNFFFYQLQELFLVSKQGVLLHWALEHAGKPNKPSFSQSVGSPSSKMTALDSTAAMNMWSRRS